MSDYEWLVELAAKGLAERDSHLMPKSITPEAFYEIMARAALDAIGLQALLEDLAQAEQELKKTEGSNPAIDGDTGTTLTAEPSDPPQYVLKVPPVTRIGCENGVLDSPNRREQGTRKAENARLRSK